MDRSIELHRAAANSYGTFERGDRDTMKDRRLSNPRLGSTTGLGGIASSLINIRPLARRTARAFSTNSSEGKFHVISDILSIPLKTFISVVTAIQDVIKLLKNAESIFAKAGLTTVLTCLYTVFIIVSAIYLLVEFIRTGVGLIKSIRFEKKEQINRILKFIEHLIARAKNSTASALELIRENDELIPELIGDTTGIELESLSGAAYVEAIKALIIRKKVQQLFNDYVSERVSHKSEVYLSRRIGSNATSAFKQTARHINQYDNNAINRIKNDIEELKAFSTSGLTTLRMIERQRKKVLKVHMFSLFALGTASLALGLSAVSGHVFSAGVMIGVSTSAAVLALAQGNAQATYIAHTGEGINPWLAIPKFLCANNPEERNFSLWRKANNTAKKVLYVALAVFSGGLFIAFDALLKSSFITRLRGRADQFDQLKSSFSIDEMTIPCLRILEEE